MVREIRIYVEGGGDIRADKLMRRGFKKFLGLDHVKAVSITLSRDTHSTFREFKRACFEHTNALNLLLVDSDEPVQPSLRQFLQDKGIWLQRAGEEQHHLMVQVMESWLIADINVLQRFYGQDFHANAIPRNQNIEAVAKDDVLNGFSRATRNCECGAYHKINHGSKLLALMNKDQVRKKSFHLDRLLKTLEAETAL